MKGSPTVRQILKVYKEAPTGLSHVCGARVLHTRSPSQGYTFGAASGSGKATRNPCSRSGRGRGAAECPGPAHSSTGRHILSMTFPSNVGYL